MGLRHTITREKKVINVGALETFINGLIGDEEEEARPQEIFTFRPQPKQMELIEACGLGDWWNGTGEPKKPYTNRIGYGGAKYGAKTYGLLGLAGIWALAYPGSQVGIFRRTYAMMEGPGAIIPKSAEVYSGIAKSREGGREWRFENGSAVYFQHCEHESDRFLYQGKQFDLLGFDQVEQFTWTIVEYLLMQNRVSGRNGVVEPVTVMTFNPGGAGNIWLYGTFRLEEKLKHWLPGGEYREARGAVTVNPSGKKMKVYFIPSYIRDNEIGREIDPGYEERLRESEPALAEAMLEGDFDIFGGMAFPNWSSEKHVCKPFEIPKHWPKWRAVDWGYDAPFVALWFTIDLLMDRVYVYREYKARGLSDQEQAQAIATNSPADEGVTITYGDPKSFRVQKNYDGLIFTTADQYMRHGVLIYDGDNNRINGKKKLDSRMKDRPDGKPGIVFFSNCIECIRTIPLLSKSERNPEDVQESDDDHAYDTVRYGLTNVTLQSEVISQEERQRKHAENPWLRIAGI